MNIRGQQQWGGSPGLDVGSSSRVGGWPFGGVGGCLFLSNKFQGRRGWLSMIHQLLLLSTQAHAVLFQVGHIGRSGCGIAFSKVGEWHSHHSFQKHVWGFAGGHRVSEIP